MEDEIGPEAQASGPIVLECGVRTPLWSRSYRKEIGRFSKN
jgi:hypothetical protein